MVAIHAAHRTFAASGHVNSLNLVWLFTAGGEPSGSTHILSSYVYKTAFTYYRFGWSAALSVVIFLMLFVAVQGFLAAGRLRR